VLNYRFKIRILSIKASSKNSIYIYKEDAGIGKEGGIGNKDIVIGNRNRY